MAVRGVDGAGFHSSALPVMRARALFQPYTAHGKLKAEMTPTTPEIERSKITPVKKIEDLLVLLGKPLEIIPNFFKGKI